MAYLNGFYYFPSTVRESAFQSVAHCPATAATSLSPEDRVVTRIRNRRFSSRILPGFLKWILAFDPFASRRRCFYDEPNDEPPNDDER